MPEKPKTCPKCGANMVPSQYGGLIHQGECVRGPR